MYNDSEYNQGGTLSSHKKYVPINECKTVYELLEDPDRWGKKYFAVDDHGICKMVGSNEACKFCLDGALRRIYPTGKDYFTNFLKIQKVLNNNTDLSYFSTSLIGFNDDPKTTHQDVLEVARKANV
jgi:hypothetical protein